MKWQNNIGYFLAGMGLTGMIFAIAIKQYYTEDKYKGE